ncbi:alpha-glucuronidase family glycosyl hydrolase [Sporosarcina jiandibaonis]|uniref:alpha-glucuronidase family glycosyl hydrolase n=1 Tax=Sporosarcina jiandibaonis TaxID=2715535 RepID=UPI0015543294|nr:alpha-glucuronidase family glycosyl hydrolase [Sporosarcina jiandibaonis]
MDQIIYWDTHETVLFAVEELARLMRGAGAENIISDRASFLELEEKYPRIILVGIEEYKSYMGVEISLNDDGFAIVHANNDTWIIGNETRSILYGVYYYCRERFGYRWIELEKETIHPVKNTMSEKDRSYIHKPLFERRGNILETIDDPAYINSLIDWGVKNGQNEYFFTFFLWDRIKSYVSPELQKRDVNVTLGGHSLSYLLKQIQQDDFNEDLEEEEKLKFFAENTILQEKVIQKIVEICLENSVINRVSLWPEDVGIDEKNADGFLHNYIRFTEKVKEALSVKAPHVEAEYIVYNAGLSWNMLARDQETEASSQVDALYAYWGRDYSTSIDSGEQIQERAYQALEDWIKQTGKKGRSLTVLEYYSDHFMLSEIFPPLLTRIQKDLLDYKTMNVEGVLNLIVPIHRKKNAPVFLANYPWKWIHHLNNYFYTRIAWGEQFEVIVEEYFTIFNEDKDFFHSIIMKLENMVSRHTKYNVPLFPARIVDPEKVPEPDNDLRITEYLEEVETFLATLELDRAESSWPIETSKSAVSSKEMMLIYLTHLKKSVNLYADAWANGGRSDEH